ncbi:hypothetical protein [Leptospira interrogans]|uniref:hypothetical protein n=1 Tax=Leptospira interrogans TaxID=173 RepID=UPI003C1303A5
MLTAVLAANANIWPFVSPVATTVDTLTEAVVVVPVWMANVESQLFAAPDAAPAVKYIAAAAAATCTIVCASLRRCSFACFFSSFASI